MRPALLAAVAAAVLGAAGLAGAQNRAGGAPALSGLRPAASFAGLADARERSLALFAEAGKVIQHPRCVNCHPATLRPLQGEEGRPHQPPVEGVAGGMGPPGMQCGTCHGPANVTLFGASLKSMPGHPQWHLAPLEMAWEGKALGDICRQIKDPARNGGKDLAALHEHMAHDSLVGWGWEPGAGREPVPGTQAVFGDLIKAWIDTGAHCPG